jgi:F420-dependent oxidoreductase-like protein
MQIGLHLNRYDWPGSPANVGVQLALIARTADAAGFASLSVMDHFFQIERLGPVDDPVLEGYSVLNYLAALTSRIKLGMLVTGVTYRHPGVLVKLVTALDVLSGGRAFFGIGAGWYAHEAHGLGLSFPGLTERFERLEETLQIAEHMWSGDRSPYIGEHYQLAEPLNRPPPLTLPHPPIMVGGSGPRQTLRLVAQYADACNLLAHGDDAQLGEQLAVLRGHCERVGRPYAAIWRTAVTGPLTLDASGNGVQELIERCRVLAALGIQELIVYLTDVHTLTPLELFGRAIIPAVAGF